MVPERHNNVKVLLLMDVGGTMDEHVQRVEELFSAVKSEFKHLEFYYFHNCVYDYMWKNNRRRFAEKFPTWDIIRKYNRDYKLIFVGDATMSPYEILQPGGSVEYHNEEPGAEWLQRLTHAFPKHAWINPEPQGVWQYRQSIGLILQLLGGGCILCPSKASRRPCGCCQNKLHAQPDYSAGPLAGVAASESRGAPGLQHAARRPRQGGQRRQHRHHRLR